jgi:chromosomal replication initiation ATPase DnaA
VTDQLLLDFGHPSASEIEDFMPAPCNCEALAWLGRWPAWPACALVLHGPAGCGKTHLARIWARRAQAGWLDRALPAEARPDAVNAYVLDDVLAGDRLADEVTLLQFYNWLAGQRGHLLITARRPAVAWPIRLPDLASRLRAAPAVAIGPPDDALLGALLVKLFGDRQVVVAEDVIRYTLAHMERSFDAARTLVAALDDRSLAQRRAITIPLVRAVLEPPERPADQRDERRPDPEPINQL